MEKLSKRFAERIDADTGYDNLKLAEDLAKMVNEEIHRLQNRIEKAYDRGFKDGQAQNPQIQEYLRVKAKQ